jgi:hypothetical protein
VNTWQTVRDELAGAWRSLRSDLSRSRPRTDAADETTDLIFP